MDEINRLPDHILVEIFGNLSPNMIKSCSLVCKRWDEIVGNSLQLMQRFTLDLDKSQNAIEEAKQIKRKHQTAIVRDLSSDSLDVISRHNLQSLLIYKSSGTKLSTLIEALNNFPMLKILRNICTEFVDDISGSSDFKKVQINLKVLQCADKIIHIFDCDTVKKLKLMANTVDDNTKMLAMDFLKRQKNLVDFNLCGIFSSEFFISPEMFEFKSSLKKFSYSCGADPFPHYEAFIKFLYQHKKTLRILNLDFCTEPQFGIEFIHKYALENLLSLKHLELGYFKGDDNHELSFNELPSATQVTKSIKSLAVRARSTDMNENRRFFAMFPNLKRLKFEGATDARKDMELLYCISEINVNVETLVLDYLNNETELLANVYFPKLKIFSLEDFYDEAILGAFISRHSKTLEEIDIFSSGYEVTHLTINEIFKCENLKHLVLCLHEPNVNIIGKINEISSRIKKFNLNVQHSYHKVNKYNFPDDEAIWRKEVEIWQKKIRKEFCFVQ